MSAYFIVYLNITEPDQFTQYFQVVMPVIERRGGRLIAQGATKIVEGMLPFQHAVVFEWKSQEDFFNYWHSDEYAEIRNLREGAAEFQAAIIEGVAI